MVISSCVVFARLYDRALTKPRKINREFSWTLTGARDIIEVRRNIILCSFILKLKGTSVRARV